MNMWVAAISGLINLDHVVQITINTNGTGLEATLTTGHVVKIASYTSGDAAQAAMIVLMQHLRMIGGDSFMNENALTKIVEQIRDNG